MQISHADPTEVREVLALKIASKLKLTQSTSIAHFRGYALRKVTVRGAPCQKYTPSDTTDEQVVIEDELAVNGAGA